MDTVVQSTSVLPEEEFQIEEGIPIPTSGRCGNTSTLPLKLLEVGQSFYVPAEKRTKGSLWSSINFFKKNNPEKDFQTKSNKGGMRVWRVA